MASDFRVIALLAAYNEADVLGTVLSDLVDQDIEVYFIDHASTDGTRELAEGFRGRGVIGVETLPERDADGAPTAWAEILKRKEDLALELEAHWFIHHDADEFRESPWPGTLLLDAIRQVDRWGFDAIDFRVLNFPPTHDGFRAGSDVREAFRHWEPADEVDRVQVRCWKKQPVRVDLAAFGGHEALFPGRRVFPLRFMLRHYPIRSQAHGERKVFHERERFAPERERGWHRQYLGRAPGASFLRDAGTLVPYDPDAVRLRLLLEPREAGRAAETGRDLAGELLYRERQVERLDAQLDAGTREADRLHVDLDARNREAERLHVDLDARSREAAGLHGDLGAALARIDAADQERARLQAALEVAASERAQLESALAAERSGLDELRARLEGLLASRSWRWTAPLRGLLDRFSA